MTLRLSTRTAWTLFIVLVLLLVAGTTMPSALMAGIQDRMWDQLPWAKLAHFTLFALIGLCPVYGTGPAAVWRIILVAVALAALTEMLQSLVPGRHPQVRDIVIDLSGTATALLLHRLLPPRRTAA